MAQSAATKKTVGFITSLISLIFGIGAIVLMTMDYQVINVKWTNSPWRHLGFLQCISTIYASIISLFGISVFLVLSHLDSALFIYSFLVLLSVFFSLGIGIFNAIGGIVYHKKNNILSCDSDLTGVLKLFENIDDYMILSHSVLCSPICPCNMTAETRDDYIRGYFFSELFTHLDLRTTEAGSNIDGCADGILQTIQNLYESNPNNTKGTHITNYKEFNKYWKKIENKYKCSGWCRTKYNDPFTMYNDTMGKYVFTDISRGIPEYLGCINRFLNYIPALVGSVGALLITIAVIQFITFISAFKLFQKGDDEHYGVNDNRNYKNYD